MNRRMHVSGLALIAVALASGCGDQPSDLTTNAEPTPVPSENLTTPVADASEDSKSKVEETLPDNVRRPKVSKVVRLGSREADSQQTPSPPQTQPDSKPVATPATSVANKPVPKTSRPSNSTAQTPITLTDIHKLSAEGKLDEVKTLLARDAPVDMRDKNNATPLSLAVWGGHRELAEFLLSKKADPNAQDVGGGRPIHWAAYQNSRELVDLLLDYKALRRHWNHEEP